MLKPDQLRKAIVAANTWFRDDPDKLVTFIDKGRLIANATFSPSFTYRYRLNLRVLDYTGELDHILLPILFWLRDNQPDLLASPEKADQAITYEADILDAATMDVSIEIELEERVIVTHREDGNWDVEHIPEPAYGSNAYEAPIDGVPKGVTLRQMAADGRILARADD